MYKQLLSEIGFIRLVFLSHQLINNNKKFMSPIAMSIELRTNWPTQCRTIPKFIQVAVWVRDLISQRVSKCITYSLWYVCNYNLAVMSS